MSGNTTGNTQALIRDQLWQSQLEETLFEHLMGFSALTRQLEFGDGNELILPSLGVPTVRSQPESAPTVYDALDSGEISIRMNSPIAVGNKISEVLQEDSAWAADMLAKVPMLQAQALMEYIEADMFALANQQFNGQNDLNEINGVAHRKVASGTNETMAPQDFAFAKYSLKKAKVKQSNLIAIVDPSVAYALETATNLVNVSNNPMWEGVISTGIDKEMRFIKNVYGFDVFESNLLADANETIDGLTTTSGKANIFTSMSGATAPFAMAWRRNPVLKTKEDFDTGDLKVKTTARYGSGLTNDENIVVILSDDDQVS